MQELKNDHKIERVGKEAIREITVNERILTNQEVYSFYAKILQDKIQLEQKLVQTQEQVVQLHNAIDNISGAIKEWKQIALEAEKLIPEEKPIDVEKEITKGGKQNE